MKIKCPCPICRFRNWIAVGYLLVTFAGLYFFVSLVAYQFRHAEKTETQRFLEIPDALLWK